jgi:ABC-type Fe3+ transport system permease subunit
VKRLFRIFELSKNEQRVVLIVILVLITIAFVEYERRIRRVSVPPTSAMEPKTSPSPLELENER